MSAKGREFYIFVRLMENFYAVARWSVRHDHELLRITYEKDPSFHRLMAEQNNTIRSSLMSGATAFVENCAKKISPRYVFDMRRYLFER